MPFGDPLQGDLRCPVCGNAALPEFYDPPGVVLCIECGMVLRRLRERLALLYRFVPAAIHPGTSLGRDFDRMGADPLDYVELIMELKDEFDITVPREVLERIETVGELIRHIEDRRRIRPRE